ncbi:MAG: beta-hydroxyacyl-ACP dehydratase [Acetobacteraceae bacterium]|nr:beta-hydroxyacyl-ACP dehydratase [Acetobacteraceae bacterium]
MIDRVLALDLAGQTIRAECRVPETSPVFEGHFPGHPILPGVLMIESMAQAGGWLLLARSGFENAAFLAQVKAAKMRDFVTPSQILLADVALQHEGSGYAVASGRLSRGDKLVAEASLTFRVMRFPNETMRTQMQAVARRIGIPGAPADA